MQNHISLHFVVLYYSDRFQSSFFNSWIKKRKQKLFQDVQSYTELSPSILLSHANTFCYDKLQFHCVSKLILCVYKDTEVFLHRFALKLDSLHTSSLPKSLLHTISRKRIDTIVSVGGVCRGRTQCFTYSLVKWAAQGSCSNLINTMLETARL